MSDINPGFPPDINAGANYAQPSVTLDAMPLGPKLDRAANWAGVRNSGAPIRNADQRTDADLRKHVGEHLLNDNEIRAAIQRTRTWQGEVSLLDLSILGQNIQNIS